MKNRSFETYTWVVLGYNLLVILWGAYVRATGSGAGCGSHWPLCNGEVIPRAEQVETLVEFTHRISSGLAFLLVLVMFVWARRVYRPGSVVRKTASLSMLFMITEALVGAGLVLFELVAHDASITRAISIVVHLLNTFILLACIVLTAWWARGNYPTSVGLNRPLFFLLVIGLAGTMLIGASGALTALGDTLFPAKSLAEGLQQDFTPTAHFLIQLRIYHPALAIIFGLFLLLLAAMIRQRSQRQSTIRLAKALTLSVLFQLGVGGMNVLLLAPVWMQLIHLLIADLVWIVLVLTTASAFSESDGQVGATKKADPTPILGPGGI